MRVVQLGKVAAQAEKLRLQSFAGRQANRAVLAIVAAVFGFGVLIAIHVAAGLALTPAVGALYATLIVGGFDLLLTLILGGVALYSKPGKIEREALMVREEARSQLSEAAVMSIVVGPLLRRAGLSMIQRLVTRPRK